MLDPALEMEQPASTASLLGPLAEYAAAYTVRSTSAIETARHLLTDALGRGFDALHDPACARFIGPIVPGALMPGGARVPGTSLELDPAQAAFCTGLMLCRAAGGGHWPDAGLGRAAAPLGAVLAVTDYQARKATMEGTPPPRVRDLLAALAKALEIQGVLAALAEDDRAAAAPALRPTQVAAAAIAAAQLGGGQDEISTAVSYACVEGDALVQQAERSATGRGDWAIADAICRAVRHACHAMATGRRGFPPPANVEIVDPSGKLRGAGRSGTQSPFGTAIIDRLAALRKPQDPARLTAQFQAAAGRHFPARQAERIKALFAAPERLDDLPVNELIAALVTNGSR